MTGVTPGTWVYTVFTGMPIYEEQKDDAVAPALLKAERTLSVVHAALLNSLAC